jgi:hypothetical protein
MKKWAIITITILSLFITLCLGGKIHPIGTLLYSCILVAVSCKWGLDSTGNVIDWKGFSKAMVVLAAIQTVFLTVVFYIAGDGLRNGVSFTEFFMKIGLLVLFIMLIQDFGFGALSLIICKHKYKISITKEAN